MTKELDLVNKLIEGADNYEKQTGKKNPPVYISKETLIELQQALLELKAIKEADPSKALKCLGLLGKFEWHNKLFKEAFSDLFNTIEQALLKSQEDKVIADFIRKHYKLGNDINKDYLELKKPITMEEDIKFKEVLENE